MVFSEDPSLTGESSSKRSEISLDSLPEILLAREDELSKEDKAEAGRVTQVVVQTLVLPGGGGGAGGGESLCLFTLNTPLLI
jgi:hypothetical protein